jgi:hypothetical protein
MQPDTKHLADSLERFILALSGLRPNVSNLTGQFYRILSDVKVISKKIQISQFHFGKMQFAQ